MEIRGANAICSAGCPSTQGRPWLTRHVLLGMERSMAIFSLQTAGTGSTGRVDDCGPPKWQKPGTASGGRVIKNKFRSRHASSAVSDAGGAAEDKDKAGEELKAITTDTRPSTALGWDCALEGLPHRQLTANESELLQCRLAVCRNRGFCHYVNQWQREGDQRVFAGSTTLQDRAS